MRLLTGVTHLQYCLTNVLVDSRLNGIASGVTTVVKDCVIDRLCRRPSHEEVEHQNSKLFDPKYFEPRYFLLL